MTSCAEDTGNNRRDADVLNAPGGDGVKRRKIADSGADQTCGGPRIRVTVKRAVPISEGKGSGGSSDLDMAQPADNANPAPPHAKRPCHGGGVGAAASSSAANDQRIGYDPHHRPAEGGVPSNAKSVSGEPSRRGSARGETNAVEAVGDGTSTIRRHRQPRDISLGMSPLPAATSDGDRHSRHELSHADGQHFKRRRIRGKQSVGACVAQAASGTVVYAATPVVEPSRLTVESGRTPRPTVSTGTRQEASGPAPSAPVDQGEASRIMPESP